MSLLEVRHALITRATDAAPGAAIPTTSTWFENKRHMVNGVEVPPPTDSLWYRIVWIPGPNPDMDGIGYGAKVRHTGIMQINVCDGRAGTDGGGLGDVPVSTEAQRIQDCFKPGLQLSYNGQGVTITSCGRTGGLYDETGAYVVAVRVYWVADVVN